VKDLLRSLLQPNPDDRIDWEHFFNHPVFKELEDVDKESQEVMASIVHPKKVDLEFIKNQENVENSSPRNNSPVNKSRERGATPQHISESFSNQPSENGKISSPNERKAVFKEYGFRYYHEKNKIMMIYLTVKKLRQLMKEDEFAEYIKTIYLLIVILAKKGFILSELTLMSLKMKNNIFKLPLFEEFTKSEDYQEVIKQISTDQQPMTEYREHLASIRKDINLNEAEMKIIAATSQGYVDLKFLDEKAKSIYEMLRKCDNAVLRFTRDQLKHFYLLTMIFTAYSIKSEVYMPYMVDNHKFEWDTFRDRHENVDSEQLWNTLLAITKEF
jgi:hypothetical protein